MSKLRILVAGDSDLLNSVLKACIARWGYEVIAVEDGEQACLALCVGNIHLCILSTDLPKISGLEVCNFIRQTAIKTQPFIILITQTVSAECMREAYMAGANDFLTTPLSLRDVKSRVCGIAGRLDQLQSQAMAFHRLDPIECYRHDLALHADVHRSRTENH